MVKKLNITIYGQDLNHTNVHHTFGKLLFPHAEKITFCTEPKNREFIEDYNQAELTFAFHMKKYEESIPAFLERSRDFLNSQDIVIMDELYYDYPSPFFLNKFFQGIKPKLILTFHNINLWFNPSFSLHPKKIIRNFYSKIYKEAADGYVVISPTILNHIRDNRFTEKPVYFLPISIPDLNGLTQKEPAEQIIVGVPGNVDPMRRDYQLLLETVENHHEKFPSIQFILIGAPVNKPESLAIIERAHKINQDAGREIIKTFEQRLSSQDFLYQIKKSDILLANLDVLFKAKTGTEIYGLTKESGTTYLSIENARPLIAPKEYKMMPGYEEQVLSYASIEDFLRILKELHDRKINLEVLSHLTFDNSHKFLRQAQEIAQTLPQDVISSA